MSQPYRIVPRGDIGLDPVVRSSTGAPRPKLGLEPWITLHQPGTDVRYADRGDTAAEILAIESSVAKRKMPNMYNYVIHQDPDDLVHEYAGPHQGAHSGGENSQAVGVLFLNGNSERVTPLQIEKFRWLVWVLQVFTVVSKNVTILGHDDMPGASTACPWNVIPRSELWRLRLPWEPAPPPPPPPPPAPVPVFSGLFTYVKAGDGYWSIARRVYGTARLADDVAALQQANNNKPLKVGDRVAVPGRAVR